MLKREIPKSQWAAITLVAAFIFSFLLLRAIEQEWSPEQPSPPPVIVEVRGDVPHPGVYALAGPEHTVSDALTAAGWKPPSAHPDRTIPPEVSVRRIRTGERIRFRILGDDPPELVIEPMDPAARFTLGFKLDLNQASETDLLLLPQMKPEIGRASCRERV